MNIELLTLAAILVSWAALIKYCFYESPEGGLIGVARAVAGWGLVASLPLAIIGVFL